MAHSLQQFRRAATQMLIRRAIKASAGVSVPRQQSAVRSLAGIASRIPMLRARVRRNMRLAFGDDVPADAERRYFQRMGWFFSNSLSIFHHGLAASPVPNAVTFDHSLSVLDDAVAEGRGLVYLTPHWAGHEIVSAIVNRQHPMVMVGRQGTTPEKAERKLKWYGALGVETLLRPSRVSTMKEAIAYLKVFKQRKMLFISPDLLADPGQGAEARIFGRTARLQSGAFALAIAARAPMIRLSFRWQDDGGVRAMFERATLQYDADDRDVAIRAGLQEWCCWFEDKLRANPENWEFWLDKSWTRLLRSTPRTSGPQ